MSKKHEIYCFSNGGSPGWMEALALADDGHVLASHCCSAVNFMKHDLGITSTWKHDGYNAHFGEGNWELVWCDDAHDPRILAALELNKKIAEAEKQPA